LSTDPPPAGTAQPAGGAHSTETAGQPDRDGAAAISISGLVRHFGERTVLRDVSIELPVAATLAVLGHNGAGKTTLLRILATLLRPHAGRVEVLGEELPRRGWAVRGRVGLLGHEPLLYRDLSGRENLRYHARLHEVAQERVEELLGAVQMRARADEPVRLLSRGMVQRLAICRAVLHEPAVLLLDEPRANLDPGAEELVEPLIGARSGATRVITSHDPETALAEADVVLALRDGRPEFVGEPSGLDAATLRELYG
jgi:heme exporter protein A